jgi:hypothetical protein
MYFQLLYVIYKLLEIESCLHYSEKCNRVYFIASHHIAHVHNKKNALLEL